MSNILSDWRQAVMDQLDTNLQGGLYTGKVVAGIKDGAQTDYAACVFVPTMVSNTADIDFARPVLTIRAWLPLTKLLLKTTPVDPGPVEQLMVDLAQCLQPIQSLALESGGLTFAMVKIVPDYPDFGVEATLRGWIGNPTTLA